MMLRLDQKTDKDILLPQGVWSFYEKLIKAIAEEEGHLGGNDDLDVLRSLGFLCEVDSELTVSGRAYYDEKFIRSNEENVKLILREALLRYPPSEVLLQLLYGVKNAKKDNALAVLKSRGFWGYSDESPLTNLLLMMNSANLIVYSKKFKTIQVIYNPGADEKNTPTSIFIEPTRPYANKLWLKRVLAECDGHIYWLDKHFTKAGLEYLWEVADANKIKEIKILSLALDVHVNTATLKEYQDLKKEFISKGIVLIWYKIDSTLIRDTHDRWILSGNTAWNLPDVNTIMSGNRSEINKSGSLKEMDKTFNDYLKVSREIG